MGSQSSYLYAFFAFKKIAKDHCMQKNTKPTNILSSMLKELCCHSEAGLEKISRPLHCASAPTQD